MKEEYLAEALDEISDRHIEEAARAEKRKGKVRPRWVGAVAAVLALVIALGILLRPGGGATAFAVCLPEYPERALDPYSMSYYRAYGYDDDKTHERIKKEWRAEQTYLHDLERAGMGDIGDYARASIPQFLKDSNGKNIVYSPVNTYMALAMCAEITDGESRAQLLDLLGVDSMEALREKADGLWNLSYSQNERESCLLANSLWLNEDVDFRKGALKTLAEEYYAASYQGEMGSKELNEAFRAWLNEQTGGLLENQVRGMELDPASVLALASTVYFRGKWVTEFYHTEEDVFHSVQGDVACPFMWGSDWQPYYWGERFSAVSWPFGGDGTMLILPDEGVSVDDLLKDPDALNFMTGYQNWENCGNRNIHLKMPKFDVSSELDLIPGLRDLGVTDVFQPGQADFSPLAKDTEGIFIGSTQHTVRVMVDEVGCVAAAVTVIEAPGACEPGDDIIDFTLDRPFLFVIAEGETPLFVGVVNQPQG